MTVIVKFQPQYAIPETVGASRSRKRKRVTDWLTPEGFGAMLMKVCVVKVRRGVPFPPVVGGLAAFATAMNDSSSKINTDIDRILDEFALIFPECIFLSPKFFP
jgi:hypothetical protein